MTAEQEFFELLNTPTMNKHNKLAALQKEGRELLFKIWPLDRELKKVHFNSVDTLIQITYTTVLEEVEKVLPEEEMGQVYTKVEGKIAESYFVKGHNYCLSIIREKIKQLRP